ncbi:hypothetical protein AAFP35_18780 [Gordonia sp. CPCC 206044]|uniref:hypothetical protein n=1 Tax=Gordonia sp. CPCC 206044 TaxID=3140793 RepID=UPI003AF3EAB9
MSTSADRPPGRFELLTHGVSGTDVERLLDVDASEIRPDPRATRWGLQGRGMFGTTPDGIRDDGVTRVGYRWGAMTSGLALQALWALMTPFALINVAAWMLPSAGRWWTWAARCALRLLGLTLTAILVAQLSFIAIDVLGTQCRQLAGDNDAKYRCWDWIATTDDGWRAVWILLALCAVLLLGAVISLTCDNDKDARDREPAYRVTAEAAPGVASDGFVHPRAARAPGLLTPHAMIGALVPAAMMLGGGPMSFDEHPILLSLTVGLIILSGLAAALCDDPRRSRSRPSKESDVLRRLWIGSGDRLSLVWPAAALVVLVLATCIALPDRLSAPVGPDDELMLLSLFLTASAIIAVVLLVVAVMAIQATRARHRLATDDPGPWLGGMHGPVVAILGTLLGAGAGVALTRLVIGLVMSPVSSPDEPAATGLVSIVMQQIQQLFLTSALSETGVRLPDTYAATTWMWGTATVATVVCVAATGLWNVRASRPRRRWAAELQRAAHLSPPHPPAPTIRTSGVPDVDPPSRRLRLTWYLAGLKCFLPGLLAQVTGSAVVLGALAFWIVHRWPGADYIDNAVNSRVGQWFQTLGLVVLLAIASALLRAIYNGIRKPKSTGRNLGVLWDLASFWPREAHPLVPPAYAPRAIRDLTQYTVTALSADDPPRPLVLCGHSQGSLLMYAVANRVIAIDERYAQRLSLMTYGSQLGWAYGRAFPTALDNVTHRRLLEKLDERWLNLVRFTDYIGDAVWSRPDPDGIHSRTGPAVVTETAGLPTGPPIDRWQGQSRFFIVSSASGRTNEVWLTDPTPGDYPIDKTEQHSAYTSIDSWAHWMGVLTDDSANHSTRRET